MTVLLYFIELKGILSQYPDENSIGCAIDAVTGTITHVDARGAAARAGIQVNDVIRSYRRDIFVGSEKKMNSVQSLDEIHNIMNTSRVIWLQIRHTNDRHKAYYEKRYNFANRYIVSI